MHLVVHGGGRGPESGGYGIVTAVEDLHRWLRNGRGRRWWWRRRWRWKRVGPWRIGGAAEAQVDEALGEDETTLWRKRRKTRGGGLAWRRWRWR